MFTKPGGQNGKTDFCHVNFTSAVIGKYSDHANIITVPAVMWFLISVMKDDVVESSKFLQCSAQYILLSVITFVLTLLETVFLKL